MKRTLLISLMTLTPLFANASMERWYDDETKVLLIAPNPTLKINLAKIDVDDANYAILTYDLKYDGSDIFGQVTDIQNDYPGYRFQRVVMKPVSKVRVMMPSLHLVSDVMPKNGSEGPYLNETLYLSKAQYQSVKQAIAAGENVVRISGEYVAQVPQQKVTERIEVAPSICQAVAGSRPTVATLVGLSSLKLSDLGVQVTNDSTRVSLLKDISDMCFILPKPANVKSLRELLGLSLETYSPGRKLVGVTKVKTITDTPIEIKYSVSLTEAK